MIRIMIAVMTKTSKKRMIIMTGQYNECHGRLRIASTLVHHFSIFRTLTQRYMCPIDAAPSTWKSQPWKEYIINNNEDKIKCIE